MMNRSLQKGIRNKKNFGKKEGRARNVYGDTDISIVDIGYRPLCMSIQNVSETGFCLRLQAKRTQLGPIDSASPDLRSPVSAPR
jgi:hypothetical protein